MIKEGVHRDISILDYHADKDYLSASVIKEANKSLKHMKWYLDNKSTSERKSHFDFGNAFEIALMDLMNGTKEFDSSVHIFDESKRPQLDKTFSSKENKEWKESFFSKNGYIINQSGKESVDTISEMLKACWSDEIIQGLLKNTDYQASCFWTDAKTGIKLKTRPDVCNINKTVLIDIKTTTDASPEGFARDVANFGYDLQALLQINGVLATGMFNEVKNYYWLAVEKEAPFNAQLYNFDSSEWDSVQMVLDYLLGLIKIARESNKWVGYSQRASNQYGIIDINIPLWHKNKYL